MNVNVNRGEVADSHALVLDTGCKTIVSKWKSFEYSKDQLKFILQFTFAIHSWILTYLNIKVTHQLTFWFV